MKSLEQCSSNASWKAKECISVYLVRSTWYTSARACTRAQYHAWLALLQAPTACTHAWMHAYTCAWHADMLSCACTQACVPARTPAPAYARALAQGGARTSQGKHLCPRLRNLHNPAVLHKDNVLFALFRGALAHRHDDAVLGRCGRARGWGPLRLCACADAPTPGCGWPRALRPRGGRAAPRLGRVPPRHGRRRLQHRHPPLRRRAARRRNAARGEVPVCTADRRPSPHGGPPGRGRARRRARPPRAVVLGCSRAPGHRHLRGCRGQQRGRGGVVAKVEGRRHAPRGCGCRSRRARVALVAQHNRHRLLGRGGLTTGTEQSHGQTWP